MREVNVPAHFYGALVVTDKQNCCQTPVTQKFFSPRKRFQESVSLYVAILVGQRLDLGLLLVFLCFALGLFALNELLASENLALSVVAEFVELAHQLLILHVEEVFLAALEVQILLVRVEVVQI